MGQALGIAGGIGMVVGVGQAGYQSDKSASALRSHIAEVKQETQDWKDKYNKILDVDYSLDANMVQGIKDTLDNYSKLQARISIERANYSNQYRQLQIVGIIFIVVIFFLLLLKQFGLLGPLWDILTYPERWAWNVIFGKK